MTTRPPVFKSMYTSQDNLANINIEVTVREKAVYTARLQLTLNTETQKHYNEHTFQFLTGVELNVIFSLLNSGGTEMMLAVCFILALVQTQFIMAKAQRSRYRSYRMVTFTGKLGSLLLQMCLFLASFWELSFSLSSLYKHLKQSNISLVVACSDVGDAASDEVLNKRIENTYISNPEYVTPPFIRTKKSL